MDEVHVGCRIYYLIAASSFSIIMPNVVNLLYDVLLTRVTALCVGIIHHKIKHPAGRRFYETKNALHRKKGARD